MHKILIVDDEMFVRKGLQSLVEWEELGYAVAGEAENGEEALALIRAERPELVISDIRMPLMDGLELIRRTNEEMDDAPLFIIISGFNDFAYAKQAIQYGVCDYILKPVDDQELVTALKKLSLSLNRKKLTSAGTEQQLSTSVMDTLINGGADEEYAAAIAAALPLAAEDMYGYAVLEAYGAGIGFKEIAAAVQELLERERLTQEDGGDAAEERRSGRSGFSLPYEQQDGRCGLLLALGAEGGAGREHAFGMAARPAAAAKPGPPSGAAARSAASQAAAGPTGASRAAERRFRQLLAYMAEQLPKLLGAPVALFAGTVVSGITHARQSYETANAASRHKYAEDGRAVIVYDDVADKPLRTLAIDEALHEALMERLEENDRTGCAQAIDAMFEAFRTERFEPNAVWGAINRSAIAIIRVIQEMDGDPQQLASFSFIKEWKPYEAGPRELRRLFGAFVEEAADSIAGLRQNQAKGGIEKIRKYIEAHYNDNINLKSIAAHFYMNPVYLGQLFRKSYGVYFNEFLLTLRMNEAKKLLRLTDLRMYEIAGKVGFQNADYFVAQFVKQEGITPKEYRNRLIGKT